jgi:hypothetical protein
MLYEICELREYKGPGNNEKLTTSSRILANALLLFRE